MKHVYKVNAPHYSTTEMWYSRFKKGDYSLEEGGRSFVDLYFLGQLDCDRRVDACSTIPTLHKSTNWLSHLKWIFFSNLHRKAQWVGIGKQAQDVPKQDFHPKKVVVSVLWNIYGVVLHHRKPLRAATPSFESKSRPVWRLRAKIYFQHDKARPHIAREQRGMSVA
ncbi:hypothetical protein OESDEN_02797 [Oesophagostomum dentatum]|uniref:Mos1 transposase HTH domain-containing protein n=1 Tax=Oesophagostomum dentatum TaxID=61180 RepID=A0A0B1TJ15_OESDE|nr:hypothetical protein OESDEN_02797 [Oesophagostomum dentatum]